MKFHLMKALLVTCSLLAPMKLMANEIQPVVAEGEVVLTDVEETAAEEVSTLKDVQTDETAPVKKSWKRHVKTAAITVVAFASVWLLDRQFNKSRFATDSSSAIQVAFWVAHDGVSKLFKEG